ncbi:FUSC family protein [Nocardioides acrostichi]|uniref:FUSC family protein n=1 Tax=Nocardioides acrostichi TaxID=2784339 RepID=A0A930UVC0_9ACTN|nr:FUSC family protein [Nocardioides acrostichi]MBF4161533.1 FUSC family protein [Nocardioides acrostichi]
MSTLSAGRHAGERPPERVRLLVLELLDRLRASDPGLGRMRQGLSAVVCVGTALPVQLGVGRLLDYPSQISFAVTMFGAVVAMLGSNALIGAERRARVRLAACFPIAVAVGLVPATLAEGRDALKIVGFTVALFLAVWVRRFGFDWFFYGFMAWMGFFFATFLQVTWSLVPHLIVAAVVSSAWVLLLMSTVFRGDPGAVLRSTLAAFFASGRSVARECADLLEVAPDDVRRRRRAFRAVSRRQASMAEAGLLADAWSAERGGVPEGWSATALRRRLLETHQAVERFAAASRNLVDGPPALAQEARRTLDHVARRRDHAAFVAAQRLRRAADADRERGGEYWWPARFVALGVQEFLAFDSAADRPPEVDPGEVEFETASTLVFGGLAGSPAVARDVRARAGRYNPLARVSMTTRQAVQVAIAGALAIALGLALSPTRYYWAVIAAFVTFTGTGTRLETFRKGVARVVGTLVGLGIAIVLAHVTAGHPVLVFTAILVSIFFAFYLMKASYTLATLFITVLLGQLYTVLGTFSDGLLALRLGETALGAGAGVLVALLFAPLSTRDTVVAARNALFDAMADLLDGAARYADSPTPAGAVRLDSRSRVLDDRARGLSLVTQPLTRSSLVGHSSRSTRIRLSRIVAAVHQCRALALDLQSQPAHLLGQSAAACALLADAVRSLRAQGLGEGAPEAVDPLTRSSRALLPERDGDPMRDDDPVVRHLHHLAATLAQLAEADPATVLAPQPHRT